MYILKMRAGNVKQIIRIPAHSDTKAVDAAFDIASTLYHSRSSKARKFMTFELFQGDRLVLTVYT